MKQIKIYFGKQQESILGSYADVITLSTIEDEEAMKLIECTLTKKDVEWFGIKTDKGVKYIHLTNVLWFDVNDVEE